MDYRSLELMDDIVVNDKSNPTNNSSCRRSPKFNKNKDEALHIPSKLRVQMQTVRISMDSEKQLYDTLKHIYGSNFELLDGSEFETKKTNVDKHYWVERGNLVIKGVIDYSSKDTTPKTEDQITRQFATTKLESYGFHSVHCAEALMHAKGHLGRALEILFEKYFGVQNNVICDLDTNDYLEKRNEEKEALESIYSGMFTEKIKNRIWEVKLKLDYLMNDNSGKKDKIKVEKKLDKEVCRLFLHKKCRFGTKCRFLHQQPIQPSVQTIQEDSYYTLEIRFPEECKYPYEPPYLYFHKNEGVFPRLVCLRIVRKLYNESQTLSSDGVPSIFSIISLLENDYEIKEYLQQNKEQFLDENELLFPKILDENETIGATHNELGSTNKIRQNHMSIEEILKEDDSIEKKFKEKQNNPRYRKMISIRKTLPVWSYMNEILDVLNENQIIIISGETGCGKSTQIPQFILDDWIINRSNLNTSINIVCTQPRRISAIGVAERVAAERDEQVGNTIGYQIRLESKISKRTRLTFCTTGILLQRFSQNPKLDGVTHVVVDEVHERSAESDFLLMLLKKLLKKREDLKIILMSATLKEEVFSEYFGKTPILHIPGKTFPVEQIFLEDIFEHTNFVLEENSQFTRKIKGNWEELAIELQTADLEYTQAIAPKNTVLDENLTLAQIFGRYPGYSSQTYKNLYIMDSDKINYDLIEKTLEWIIWGEHEYPKTGSILIFLPGFAEIVTLKNQLATNKNFSVQNRKFVILPLHSSLTSEDQALVFKKVMDGARKIILSTNIAETSVTIDDCVFVIDTGKMKETRFNSSQNMESLETCWVSRANALQRKGRAGRVMPGICISLFTSWRFKYHLSAQPIPEILRISLEPLLLRIHLIFNGIRIDLHNILDKLLEPPTHENILNAKKSLQDIGALDSDYKLTPLGHHLASLPVNVRIGKLILFGAIFCCLDSALTIAACLSHKSPFNMSFDKRQEINEKKKEFLVGNSDHLTILRAYKKWHTVNSKNYYAGRAFADQNGLSIRTLQTLADIKHQLLELLVSIGFVPINLSRRQMGIDNVLNLTGSELNIQNENYKLLQGLICAALYPNVVKVLTPEKSFQIQATGAIPIQTTAGELKFQTKQDGFVAIHPSSVNHTVGNFTSPYLVFQEKIKTSRIFIKEVSMIPVLSLILFSGYELRIEIQNDKFMLTLDDGWIMFIVESHKVAQLLQRIRSELIKLLEQKMQDPLLNLLNHQSGKRIIQTIVNIVTKE